MKEIEKITDTLFHIVSEPGDATRYDYFVYWDYDDFCFMPCKSTFRYPQRLNYYNIKDIDEDEIVELANKQMCNPWTLKECRRTIMVLKTKEERCT